MANTALQLTHAETTVGRVARPGESWATSLATALCGLGTAAGTFAAVASASGSRPAVLTVVLALWCGLAAGVVGLVFRAFEVVPRRRAGLMLYGVVGATATFGVLAALIAGMMIASRTGAVVLAVFVGMLVVVQVGALALGRAQRWPEADADARLPLGVLEAGEIPRTEDVSLAQRIARRSLDLIGGSLLLLVAAPVMALVAAAVKVDSRGPVLYSQARVGLGGEVFRLRKFRSMSTDAESDGVPRWAQSDDPRVTRVGRILRRWRLDELPQLFDVLIGRMSLVGPRPERPEFVAELRTQLPAYDMRHTVKPGLTGWAQVRYTYAASVDEAAHKLEYDAYYVAHRSVLFDLKILADTAPAVLFGRGSQ